MSENRGAGNGGTPQEQQQQQQEQPAWAKELAESTKASAAAMQSLLELAQDNSRKMLEMQGNKRAEPQPLDEEDLETAMEALSDAQLEALPRKQFMTAMLKEFNKNLTAQLKPLQDGVANAQSIAIGNTVRGETEKFAEKTPDFHEWAKEMTAIAETSPNLHIRRIYAIARAEDPGKAKEMDKKYAKPAGDDRDDGKGTQPQQRQQQQKKQSFGGLSPSSSGGHEPNRRQTVVQAAQAAWDDTVAKLGNPFET